MSDIFRAKVHRGKRGRHFRRFTRRKSLAPASRKFATRFPRFYRKMVDFGSFLKKHPALIALILTMLLGFFLSFLFEIFPSLALSYSNTVAHFLRICLAILFSVFPFSFGEILCLLFLCFLPIWCVTLVFALRRKYRFRHIRRKMRRILLAPILALALVLCLFLFTFSPAYQRPALAATLGISEHQIYDKDLYDTLTYFVHEINSDLEHIRFDENGFSVMEDDFSAMAMKVNLAYQTVSGYQQISPASGTPAKSLLSSPILVKFGLAGIYSFFTGEANVNTAYPDFLLPHTAAHESAHQRGIASENDADFIAFVACASASDPYIRYSGHLNTLLTMRNELSKALSSMEDTAYRETITERVNEILSELDGRVLTELQAYSAFLDQNHNETLSEAAESLNDTYLKTQGQNAGVDSYQYLTGLIVNFYTTYLA